MKAVNRVYLLTFRSSSTSLLIFSPLDNYGKYKESEIHMIDDYDQYIFIGENVDMEHFDHFFNNL